MYSRLISRSLAHFWRTNLAVVAGVAVAVTVLAGALLVGDSVRGSLRDLALRRIGATDLTVISTDFFTAGLADRIQGDADFGRTLTAIAPIVSLPGLATEQETGRRASNVLVYGVDDRFWSFHAGSRDDTPASGDARDLTDRFGGDRGLSRDMLLSPALARELQAERGDTVLLRVQRPSDIPLESLHGRKDELGRTVRATVSGVLPADALGEFSLQPQQADVRAAFVPLARLQDDLDIAGRTNALLVSAHDDGEARAAAAPHLEALVRRHATLEDIGLQLRVVSDRELSLEALGALIDEPRARVARATASALSMNAWPVFTYLVNTIRSGVEEIPYSLVTALDLERVTNVPHPEEASLPPILLTDWAARDLGAAAGARVTLEYYVWRDPGQLVTERAEFRVGEVIPLQPRPALDFAPQYPGITDSESLSDWDPPFPIDLKRVRPEDEQFWDEHRTTSKAFVPLPVGEALWGSRYGSLTSIRVSVPDGIDAATAKVRFEERLRSELDPLATALAIRDVRTESLAASQGATDFGEYFTYFSFFLVVSALMLAALFFKLSVEGRVREVGLLRAVGFTTNKVRLLFGVEALALATIGSALGVLGAVGYGALIMRGLRTWWVDAVGTTSLTLHVAPASLVAGALMGVVAAVACIWWTLGTLARVSEKSLLAGQLTDDSADAAGTGGTGGTGRTARMAVPVVTASLGVLLALAGYLQWIAPMGAFFGAAALLLIACLSTIAIWLRRPPRQALTGGGMLALARLGWRNATYRPARSVLSIAVVAAATFILISVDAFRRDPHDAPTERHSGSGGYALLVNTVLPIVVDPNSADGREQIGLPADAAVSIAPLRVRPGDDASCLNLYAPRQPKIAAVNAAFIREGRFAFAGTLDGDERENPWVLLDREFEDGAVPVIADANSMTYVLHKAIGEDIEMPAGAGTVRLRLVASLSDSVLQGELMMSEANFQRLFPAEEGYRMFLVDAPAAAADAVGLAIEERLADAGADAISTGERLAEFHRVENTYLSTFQTLGGLGLLVGTIGLAAVLLRNVLERRRELALLGAVGYGRNRLLAIIVAESTLLLACGLAVGVLCALVAVAPAAFERGGRLPTSAGAWLLVFSVFAAGLVSSLVATRAAIHTRLLDALRAE